MATRSRIGVVLPDGSVQSTYCHNDGYPSGVGRDLQRSIRTYEEAKAFVDEGDRSTVDNSYHNWRGEDIKFRIDDSIEKYWKSDLEEYGYLFQDGKWECRKYDGVIQSL